jgi:hypothetical protein
MVAAVVIAGNSVIASNQNQHRDDEKLPHGRAARPQSHCIIKLDLGKKRAGGTGGPCHRLPVFIRFPETSNFIRSPE